MHIGQSIKKKQKTIILGTKNSKDWSATSIWKEYDKNNQFPVIIHHMNKSESINCKEKGTDAETPSR